MPINFNELLKLTALGLTKPSAYHYWYIQDTGIAKYPTSLDQYASFAPIFELSC
jgi:hypothetical protein